jgi:hypothetical protein
VDVKQGIDGSVSQQNYQDKQTNSSKKMQKVDVQREHTAGKGCSESKLLAANSAIS